MAKAYAYFFACLVFNHKEGITTMNEGLLAAETDEQARAQVLQAHPDAKYISAQRVAELEPIFNSEGQVIHFADTAPEREEAPAVCPQGAPEAVENHGAAQVTQCQRCQRGLPGYYRPGDCPEMGAYHCETFKKWILPGVPYTGCGSFKPWEADLQHE